MIKLLLVGIFFLPCLAVEPERNMIDAPSTSAKGPITRWLELYKQIFDVSPISDIDMAKIKSILDEMFEVEQTEAYRVGLRPLMDFHGYHIDQFKDLVKRCYEGNLLTNPDATITSLLLQTFNYESNDCSFEYFNQLVGIRKRLENFRIAGALQENGELQYRNCWARFMQTLSSTSSLLGTRVRNLLNNLVASLYPHLTKPVVLLSNHKSREYLDESSWIGRRLAEFLEKQSDGRDTSTKTEAVDREYAHLVLNPCKLLVDRTNQIMIDLHKVQEFSGNRRDLITADDSLILNRYTLCYRILADTDFILARIMHLTVGYNWQKSYNPKKKSADRIELQDKDKLSGEAMEEMANISTDLRLGLSDQQDNSMLITQILPSNDQVLIQNIDSGHSSQQKTDTRRVVSVGRCVGKTTNVRYPTEWSDGTTSMETPTFLMTYWPEQFNIEIKRKACETQARYIDRLAAKRAGLPDPKPGRPRKRRRKASPTELTLEVQPSGFVRPHPNPGAAGSNDDLKVVRVEKAIGRGPSAKYPTHWSDGSITEEKKEYLIANWFEAWTNRFLPI